MLKLVLPIALGAAGLAAGAGAAFALRPAPVDTMAETPEITDTAPCGPGPTVTPAKASAPTGPTGFVKLDNQFVIPVLESDSVASLVVLNLTLEVAEPEMEVVATLQPKLRDRFLRVMLDHANTGGFSGAFTSNGSVDRLHNALMEVGRGSLGDKLHDVLILDLNRQDV